jgi:hypothetical protein
MMNLLKYWSLTVAIALMLWLTFNFKQLSTSELVFWQFNSLFNLICYYGMGMTKEKSDDSTR